MEKIGIITMYYNSSNYGGLLQAYALCKYLNLHEKCCAEQICFNPKDRLKKEKLANFERLGILGKLAIFVRFGKKHLLKTLTKTLIGKKVRRRKLSVVAFRENIPHSKIVYNKRNIGNAENDYDIFITGSDRVWKPDEIDSPYFLQFVREKTKISYAASLAANVLTEQQKVQIAHVLKNYSLISVREKDSVDILAAAVNNMVHWVVDPTFLLTQSEWNELLKNNKNYVKEQYVFCYFLGKDRLNREFVRKFADEKKLRIVTIPYAKDELNFADLSFGDLRKYDATPEEFITLIKNAEYIFTDSFHATVFSTIYDKEVFSLNRADLRNSGTRLQSLVSMLGTESHYITNLENMSLQDFIAIKPIDYSLVKPKLEQYVRKSRQLLHSILVKQQQ